MMSGVRLAFSTLVALLKQLCACRKVPRSCRRDDAWNYRARTPRFVGGCLIRRNAATDAEGGRHAFQTRHVDVGRVSNATSQKTRQGAAGSHAH
jgi:hypothetical protein